MLAHARTCTHSDSSNTVMYSKALAYYWLLTSTEVRIRLMGMHKMKYIIVTCEKLELMVNLDLNKGSVHHNITT